MADEEIDGSNVKKKSKAWEACKKIIVSHVPILEWLPKYKFKEYFLGDLLGGVAIGCMHVPQALAFAFMSKADPIMGLYTTCFPVMLYCFLGTAPISCYGPAVIPSIMTGEAVSEYRERDFTNNELIRFLTFFVGVIYLTAYLLRLAAITKIFTKPVTSAFTAAASTHCIVKIISVMLGIVPDDDLSFYFHTISCLYHIYLHITETNFVTLGLSLAILTAFTFDAVLIKPLMAKCTRIIFPMELLVTIIAVGLSHYMQFDQMGVELIGDVPTGFSEPKIPRFEVFGNLWYESIEIALVGYVTSLSILIMYNPDVRADQELFALSVANIVFCSFHILPFSNSIVGTLVAKATGVSTLLANMISSFLMLFVILFMGPLFHCLPICVVASVAVYWLFCLLIKSLREMRSIFRLGKESAFIWILTLLVTLFVAIQIGLLAGLTLSLRQILAEQTKRDREEADAATEQNQDNQPINNKRR